MHFAPVTYHFSFPQALLGCVRVALFIEVVHISRAMTKSVWFIADMHLTYEVVLRALTAVDESSYVNMLGACLPWLCPHCAPHWSHAYQSSQYQKRLVHC